MVTRRCDVVVVGARCSGSSLATHLAAAGVDVVVVDRATFPSDTTSTHVFQGGGIRSLHRLGVLERVGRLGAPPLLRGRYVFDLGVDRVVDFQGVDGLPPAYCVRRVVLDHVLVERAVSAGAELLHGTVRHVLAEGGRVRGVVVDRDDGEPVDVEATLVVGADGMHSTVGRLVGARAYHVIPNERFFAYGYFAGAPADDPATLITVRQGRHLGFGCPTDGGLTLVVVGPDLDHAPDFRADTRRGYLNEVAAVPELKALVDGGELVGRPRTAFRLPAFFRESAGPGWALVGDAGHFKDPTPGQGIADSFRQSERLAAAVLEGLGGRRGGVDRATRRYWRWRDRDARNRHWWAHDMGKSGELGAIPFEIVRRLSERDRGPYQLWAPVLQQRDPAKVFGPWAATRAAARLLYEGATPARDVARELRAHGADYLRRRWFVLRPRYEPPRDSNQFAA